MGVPTSFASPVLISENAQSFKKVGKLQGKEMIWKLQTGPLYTSLSGSWKAFDGT
jgi:hypothetical protein